MKSIPIITFKSLIFIVLIFALFTSISSRFSIDGIKSYVVLTGSMKPVIDVNSLIYITAEKSYKIGDIITFQKGKIDITHRIVSINSIGRTILYQTKGDANKTNDPQKVYANDVVGKVIFTIPIIGKLILFVKTLPGFLLIIVLPTLIFIAFEIRNIKSELEKEIEKKLLKKLKAAEREAEHVIEKL